MLNRLLIGIAILFGLAAPVQGAGTVPGFSLSPQFDTLGKVMPGCKLYVVQAGTTSTPQNSYQDSGLTIVNPNPLSCDSTGRLPQWFVADGSIKVRLTTATGSTVFTGDNLLVIGASSGGGGGSPVDPTTVLATGDIKSQYSTNTLAGWVRANGRTIGNASSGATERANADTSALFTFLYNADGSLAVSGGRGASAAADYAANKTITLPDFRGRVLASFDDMGNSAAGRLTTSTMTGNGIGAVASSGQLQTLITANLPAYTPTGGFSSPLFSGTLNSGTLVGGSISGGSISGTLNNGTLTGGTISGTLNSGTLVGGSISGTLNSGTLVSGTASVTSANWIASSASDSTPINPGGSGGSGITASLSGGLVSKVVSNGSASGNVTGTVSGSASGSVTGTVSGSASGSAGTVTGSVSGSASGSVTGSVTGTVSGSVSGVISGDAQGGTSTAFSNVQPTIFVTTYIKL
jgi:hypothetical protein